MSRTDANEYWQKMEYFSGYSFNKCLHASTLIETTNGNIPISNVAVGDSVNSKNGLVVVKNVFKQGKKKLYKIKTKTGKNLILTMDHKMETEDGFKTLKDILKFNLKILVNPKV